MQLTGDGYRVETPGHLSDDVGLPRGEPERTNAEVEPFGGGHWFD